MKQVIFLLLCFIPLLITAQMKTPSDSEIQNDKSFIALKAEIKPIEAKIEAINQEYLKAPANKKNDPAFKATLEKRYTEVVDEMTNVMKNFVTKNPNSYISLVVLSELFVNNSRVEVSTIASLYKNLSEQIKKTDLGKELETKLFSTTQTSIGAVAPDFTQNDTKGKPVKLSDFRGKYVLIDFWASWCGPCRQENPNVVRAYAQFKSKNFEILGVSLDNPNAKTAWLNAIEKDKLTWTQVSDLQGWTNQVARLYGVESIPQNFLIDPNGVIIAKNLRGENLIRTLSNILK